MNPHRDANDRPFRLFAIHGCQIELLLANDGKVLEVIQTTFDHADILPGEIVGEDVWDTLWWCDNPAGQEILKQACATCRMGESHTWLQEFRQPGWGPLTLELSISPRSDEERKPHHHVLVARDVTERILSAATQNEVDALTTMGRIAGRVAHEINNPLAGIQNAFLLIKDAVPRNHPHYGYLAAIEREVARIANVIRQLYETYRPEPDTGNGSSFVEMATDAASFLRHVNGSRGITIETDFTGIPGPVPIPGAILRQIFYNLLQNAIDAARRGGTVSVVARATATALYLTVGDERRGMLAPSSSAPEKGTDMSSMAVGLVLVQRTVAAAGGTIAAAAGSEGGTEFLVTLPFPPSKKASLR